MCLSCDFVNMFTKLVNVYMTVVDNNKVQLVLRWFSVVITTSWLVMAAATCSCPSAREPSVKFICPKLLLNFCIKSAEYHVVLLADIVVFHF